MCTCTFTPDSPGITSWGCPDGAAARPAPGPDKSLDPRLWAGTRAGGSTRAPSGAAAAISRPPFRRHLASAGPCPIPAMEAPGTAPGKGNRGERGRASLRGHKRSPFRKERRQPSPMAAVSLSQPGFEGTGLSQCFLQAGLEIQVEPRPFQAAQSLLPVPVHGWRLSTITQGTAPHTVSHYTPCSAGSTTVPPLVHHSPPLPQP